jgi:hypothetical protein
MPTQENERARIGLQQEVVDLRSCGGACDKRAHRARATYYTL